MVKRKLLRHLFFAAFLAISARRSGVMALARAAPPFFDLSRQNFHDVDSVADDVGGALLAFWTSGMAHLPHGLSEMLSNRCHGALDVDLM
jgi:hypothetical protein